MLTAFGRDPRYVYAASRMGGAAGYNQTGFDWTIVTYDRETGETATRAGAGAVNSGSMRTVPVNHSADPRFEGCEPARVMFIVVLTSCC